MKTSINESYFKKITSPTQAYLFGLMWADGCISGNRLSIGLKSSDAELLEIASQEIGNVIKHRKRYDKRTDKNYFVSEWYVNSEKIVKDIKSLGFRKKPKFAKKWFPWFLLGFFDGDGNVHLTKSGHVQVCFAAPKNHDWEWFYNAVKTLGKFEFTEIHRTGKDGHSGSDLRIFGLEALKLLDKIQQGNLGLSRKRSIYLKAKEIYKNKRIMPIRRTKTRVVR